MVCIGGDVLYLYNLFKAYWALCRRSGADQWNTQHFIYLFFQTLLSQVGTIAGTFCSKAIANGYQRQSRHVVFTGP